jgi:hypothetical protein
MEAAGIEPAQDFNRHDRLSRDRMEPFALGARRGKTR